MTNQMPGHETAFTGPQQPIQLKSINDFIGYSLTISRCLVAQAAVDELRLIAQKNSALGAEALANAAEIKRVMNRNIDKARWPAKYLIA